MPTLRRLVVQGIDSRGFLYRREIGDRLIGVLPLYAGRARLGIGPVGSDGFDDVWDFPNRARAIAVAHVWNPDEDPEPPGWHRHPGSGRRRPDGDPAREYILR